MTSSEIKFKHVYDRMVSEHRQVFDAFENVHNAFASDPQAHKKEFNTKGSEILDIIRTYERILCSRVSSGSYSKFAHRLSDKFWNEIRKKYPKIDLVGIE